MMIEGDGHKLIINEVPFVTAQSRYVRFPLQSTSDDDHPMLLGGCRLNQIARSSSNTCAYRRGSSLNLQRRGNAAVADNAV